MLEVNSTQEPVPNITPTLQPFVVFEDKAMDFYEELLRQEADADVRRELVKAYSQLILKRIELNQQSAKNFNTYHLEQMKHNAELCKLDKTAYIESIKRQPTSAG